MNDQGFGKKKVGGVKDIIFLLSLGKPKKFQHKKGLSNFSRTTSYTFYINKPEAKCKEEDLHTKNQNTYKRKKNDTKFYVQKYGRGNYDFNSENILLYSPQKDRALNASKNKVRNNAIGR